MTIRLSPALPEDERNGLDALTAALIRSPGEARLAVVSFDAVKLTTAVSSGDVVVTVRLRAIEPATTPDDDAALRRLLHRAYEHRTGQAELPLPLENDLTDSAQPAAQHTDREW